MSTPRNGRQINKHWSDEIGVVFVRRIVIRGDCGQVGVSSVMVTTKAPNPSLSVLALTITSPVFRTDFIASTTVVVIDKQPDRAQIQFRLVLPRGLLTWRSITDWLPETRVLVDERTCTCCLLHSLWVCEWVSEKTWTRERTKSFHYCWFGEATA